MKKALSAIRKYIPLPALFIFSFFLITVFIYIASLYSPALADTVNSTVSHLIRRVMAMASELFPFSLFELLMWMLLPLCVLVVVLAARAAKTRASRIRAVITLLSVISLVATSYVYTLGIGYRTTELSEKMDLGASDTVSKEALYSTALIVRDEVNTSSLSVKHVDGEARMEYSMTELSKRINEAFEAVIADYPVCITYPTRAKPIIASGLMSDAGITGIYTFFTGECNINMSYPDYNLPFTVAHEFAHARGVIRENEANFIAFLVCSYSDDPFIRYSGYLSLYSYLSSALYRTDEELYRELFAGLSESAVSDLRRASEVSREHSGTWLGEVSDKLNDAYLKSNGTEGVVSYGYVVRLAVEYYSKINQW